MKGSYSVVHFELIGYNDDYNNYYQYIKLNTRYVFFDIHWMFSHFFFIAHVHFIIKQGN